MVDVTVLCGGAAIPGHAAERVLRLDLAGKNANVTLEFEDIRRAMLANTPDILTDLLEVATYVYCADQLVSRGGASMRSLGADWRRRFRFVIPVREPDIWTSTDVCESLGHVLSFMSDDEMSFEFVSSRISPPASHYFRLSDSEQRAFEAEETVMFSGGLDSLAGAVRRLEKSTSRLVLISHQSSPQMAKRQRDLAQELGARFPNRVLHVPVRVIKRGSPAVEITQRTRTFLFAALGSAVTRMMGRSDLGFFENGVVSFNLPIAGQVVGARATRSTHPRVIHDVSHFLTKLLGKEFHVHNPFIWRTKTEVATVLASSSQRDLTPYSVSCSHVYGMTRLATHCGKCFQCIDRRFATLAAGLADVDPEEMYGVDLLTGERNRGFDRTMAESYVRHVREIRRMTELGFVGKFAGEVSRATLGFPNLTSDQVMKNTIAMHKRHAESVISVLDDSFRHRARELAEGSLSEDCLLRMVGGSSGSSDEPPIRDPTELDGRTTDKDDHRDFSRTSEILLAIDPTHKRIAIRGIPPIKGTAGYALVSELVKAYQRDMSRRRAPENHSYVSTPKLTSTLGIDDAILRRRVKRFRSTVASHYKTKIGLALVGDAVIESKKWQGYRMNPRVRIVALDQIERAPESHDFREDSHDSDCNAKIADG